MKVWLLDTGTLRMDRSQMLWNVPGGELRELPVGAVLIEHDGGLLLADTGMEIEHANEHLPFMQPEQSPAQTLVAQLELCGATPADVDTVFNSHLHFDHANGNHLFPHAEIVVHAREVSQARAPAPFERLAYSDRRWGHTGAPLTTFTGDEEVVPGVRAIETPGHSAGHCSLLVESPSRRRSPMVFTFDVAYTERALEREIQPGFHHDPVAGQRSIARLKEIAAQHEAEVFFSHDAAAWSGYKRAPEFYEL